jgi:hypothetical protein
MSIADVDVADVVTFEAAIAHLRAHVPGSAYLPQGITEGITALLYGGSGLSNWTKVAKSCHDHGRAITLFVELFPEDRFLVGCGLPEVPGWSLAVLGPPPPDGGQPQARFVTCHQMLCIAVMLAILERKRRGAA